MPQYVEVTRPFHRGPIRIVGSQEEYISLNAAVAYAKRHLVPTRQQSMVEGQPVPKHIQFESLEGNYIGELSERGGFVDPLAGLFVSHELNTFAPTTLEIPTPESIRTKKRPPSKRKQQRPEDKYLPPKKPMAAKQKRKSMKQAKQTPKVDAKPAS